jgi:hypothetical protein
MTTLSHELASLVAIRARVAFALGIAERVLPVLLKNADAFQAARAALDDGWRWEQGESLRASKLYESHIEALAVQGSLLSNVEESAAMCAVTSAFFYVLWHAFRQELSTSQVSEGDVPNDMADVTEEVIDEMCDFAARTSVCDRHWISALATRLSTDVRATNPDDLGPVVSREYFTSA